ncbi:hypothetical protein Tco_0750411 [Tanacetum coccineum]|uniref:Uncharacterized protein n=1 Tax=Tanacetum coccineum TaxID=301880 RepID=A0ABQ4Z254_9ASTR
MAQQQQHAADVHPDELCPPNKRYDLMDANKKVDLEHVQCSPESKILTNIIKNHPLRFSIAASSSVPWIYMAQFWNTLKEDGLKYRLRFMLDKKELTLTLDDFRKIFHLPQATANNHNSFMPPPSFSNMVPFYKQDRARDMYHNLQDDDIMKNIFNSGRHKNKVGMKIPDRMITDEMKQTEHYRMYTEVFRIDVPLTQSQPTESTHGTHRKTSAPRSSNPDKEVADSSANCHEEQEARENVALVDEHLASEEIEKMVEKQENIVGSQSQTSSVPEQQYQLYLAMKADPQLQQQDIAIWCNAKRQNPSEYEDYVSRESIIWISFSKREQAPSTSGNQEQDDDFDFWTDSYALDDDEIPTKQVSQDIMEEVSLTIDEAKLRKMADEMLRQRCTSGDEHHVKKILKRPALSLINQDLLDLKKEILAREDSFVTSTMFPAIIFKDDDSVVSNFRCSQTIRLSYAPTITFPGIEEHVSSPSSMEPIAWNYYLQEYVYCCMDSDNLTASRNGEKNYIIALALRVESCDKDSGRSELAVSGILVARVFGEMDMFKREKKRFRDLESDIELLKSAPREGLEMPKIFSDTGRMYRRSGEVCEVVEHCVSLYVVVSVLRLPYESVYSRRCVFRIDVLEELGVSILSYGVYYCVDSGGFETEQDYLVRESDVTVVQVSLFVWWSGLGTEL